MPRPRQQLLFPIDVEVAVIPPQGLEEEESHDAGEKNLVCPVVCYQRINRLDSVGDLRASKDGDVGPLLYRKDSLQATQLLGHDPPRTRRQDVRKADDGGGGAVGGGEGVEDACVEVSLQPLDEYRLTGVSRLEFLILLGCEPEIVEHHDLTVAQLLNPILGCWAVNVLDVFHP